MRLILLGGPGVGKGTQAAVLSEKFNIPHISTGDIFRSNIKRGTELGKRAKEYMDKGALVPDQITVDIVEDRLKEADCENGFVLDGFPRTIPQAEFLEKVLDSMKVSIDYVIEIQVSDSTIVKRMSGRRVCSNCGASYHTAYNPPKKENVCDICQGALIQRSDDKEETVIERLRTYHAQTEPLISYYKGKGKLVAVEGQDEIEDTTKEVLTAIGEI